MTKISARTSCAAGILWLVLGCAIAFAQTPAAKVRTVKGTFDDVKERVVMALENRGLVISYTAHVGTMLERTGRDLGNGKPIFGNAETLEFCSARLSRDTMEADPHNIVFCPYAIAVYTLPESRGMVYLSYRVPTGGGSAASVRTLRAVEQLLADIVSEAAR